MTGISLEGDDFVRPRHGKRTNQGEDGQAPGIFAASGSTGDGDAARTGITSQYGLREEQAVCPSLSREEDLIIS